MSEPTTHRTVTAAAADKLPDTSVIRHPAETWPFVRQGGQWRRNVGDETSDVDLAAIVAEHFYSDFDVLYVPPVALTVGDVVTVAHLFRLPLGTVLVAESGATAVCGSRDDESDRRWRWIADDASSTMWMTPAEAVDGDLWRLAWLPGWRTESLR